MNNSPSKPAIKEYPPTVISPKTRLTFWTTFDEFPNTQSIDCTKIIAKAISNRKEAKVPKNS